MAEGTHLTGPAAVTQLALVAAREWAASAIRVADEIEAEGFEAAQKGAIFDMITPADGQIERFVRSEAARRFPDHHFLGEEEGGGTLDDDAWTWVVDPIDGTLNYATGLAGAASSIALVHGGEPVIGAIGDFSTHRVYSAAAGSGRVRRARTELRNRSFGRRTRRWAWPASSSSGAGRTSTRSCSARWPCSPRRDSASCAWSAAQRTRYFMFLSMAARCSA